MTDANPLFAQAQQAASLLKMLSHPQRLLILCILIDCPGTEAGELSQRCGLSPSATSQHLARMKSEGLVESTREARYVRYQIKDNAVHAVIATLKQLYCPGE